MPSKYSIRYGSAYCNASGEAPNKTRMGRANSRPMTINTPAQHNNSVQARFKISPARGLIPAAAGDGEQRCAAAAEQIAERRNNDNNGEAKPQRAQRRRADIRDARNINAVHNVIQQGQHLRHQHGQRCFQDVLCNAAVFKVDLPHGEWFVLSVFTIPVSSIA